MSATPAGDADVIAIQAESGSAERAATIANAYADAYVAVRRQQTEEAIDRRHRRDPEADHRAPGPDRRVPGRRPGARDPLVAQQTALRQQLDRLQVLRAVKSGAAEVVTLGRPAHVARSRPAPAGPACWRASSGLVLAVGRRPPARADRRLAAHQGPARAGGRTCPCIGTIPTVGSFGVAGPAAGGVARHPPVAGHRGLPHPAHGGAVPAPSRGSTMIQVTSPTAGDGKTTTLANLGVALARAGQQVVLVCCDLRRPKLHEFFGLTNDVGFTSVLLGKVPLSAALQQVPDQDRLYVLASGPAAAQPVRAARLPPGPGGAGLAAGRGRDRAHRLAARAAGERRHDHRRPGRRHPPGVRRRPHVDRGDVTRAVEQLRQVERPAGRRHPQRRRPASPPTAASTATTASNGTGRRPPAPPPPPAPATPRAGPAKASRRPSRRGSEAAPARRSRPCPPAAEDRDRVAKRRS